MAASFKRTCAGSVVFSAPDPAAGHCRLTAPPETPRHSTGKSQLFVDHNELWKILKEIGIPDHLTCLLRNLYAGQEATVKTRH